MTLTTFRRWIMGKLIIENNAFNDICAHISSYYKAGYIAVIYENGYETLALDIAAALDKGNYRSRTVNAIGNIAEKLNDEYRFTVGVGGIAICNVLKAIAKPYCMCLTMPTLKCFDNTIIELNDTLSIKKGNAAQFTIIDKKHLQFGWKSSLWGEIMQLMQLILDYNVVRYVSPLHKANIYDDALKILDAISLLNMPEDSDLWDAYTECAKLYPEILNDNISKTTQIAAELIAEQKNIDYGDACMLCAMYYFHAAYALIGSDVELAFPPDKDALTDQISRKFGFTRINNDRSYIIKHEIIMRYDYVINEYRDDIRRMISERFVNMNNACKIWRRLKNDVGYGVSRTVTIREIGETVGYASLLGRGYGILRHYKEMGVA